MSGCSKGSKPVCFTVWYFDEETSLHEKGTCLLSVNEPKVPANLKENRCKISSLDLTLSALANGVIQWREDSNLKERLRALKNLGKQFYCANCHQGFDQTEVRFREQDNKVVVVCPSCNSPARMRLINNLLYGVQGR